MSFKIALPRGNHIEQNVLDILAQKEITVARTHPRQLRACVEGFRFITRAQFCRSPSMIDLLVKSRSFVAGVCGKDTFLEHGSDEIDIYGEFTSSKRTRAVLFTRMENPVSTLDDFLEEAKRATVFSEYPRMTRSFLADQCHYGRIVGCKSPEDLVCAIERCKYGVALVETGTTLAVNDLKEIEGGTIFESCTVLIGRKDMPVEVISYLNTRLCE
ncbi:MAG TPA: hypothetical protein VI483_00550 [Candidatus Paceibacterota bacterium]